MCLDSTIQEELVLAHYSRENKDWTKLKKKGSRLQKKKKKKEKETEIKEKSVCTTLYWEN